ncbi:ATP-binding protein [Sunxiuqinia sp. A32]|uniref:ATP-binding protein n=1 Tax=Sunxiuqinia sp. A32 TaxID=3461496 RepID=UPI0040460D9E
MKNQLENQIRQIAETINHLEDGEVDIHSLLELDELLDILNKKIRSTKLGNPLINQSKFLESIRYEAILVFDRDFKVYKYTGSIDHLSYPNKDTSFSVQDLLKFEDGKQFVNEVGMLTEDHNQRTFDVDIHSKQGVPLSASINLELLSSEKGKELIFAGINFNNTSLIDIQSYQQIVIENLPDIDVYLFDNDYRYVLAGGREKERFGLTNSYFAGKTLFEAFDEKINKRFFPFYRKALSGEMADGEIRIEGQIYYIWATPVRNFYHEVVGGTAIVQNVTKDKQIEHHLKKAKDDAQKADQAKSVFLASMSHEIRTPLNAIIGFTEQLGKTDLNDQQQKFLDLIGESSDHLLYLVNEILILFKLGMGKVYIDKSPFSLIHLLNVVYDSFIIKANERKLDLSVHIDADAPDAIVGDSFRLKQVLINLLSNAIKYTDSGAIDLRCKLYSIDRENVKLRFEIQDTGPGISDDILPIIFDEFTQSKTGIDKQRKGAGLGLAITKKLVELLGGSIHVESEYGVGSTFTVDLSFQKVNEKLVVEKENVFSIHENLLKGKRILIADDDVQNLFLAETMLKNWQVEYKMAEDGKEALNLLLSDKFDIALLDIHMPNKDGIEVVNEVRSQKYGLNYHTKMLAVTANVLKSDIRNYMDTGFSDYILKPFREVELYSKICNVLQVSSIIQTKGKSIEKGRENNSLGKIRFDTDNLKITANGDVEFFNKMLFTFIRNTQKVRDKIQTALNDENWNEIGEKAHRAIPSFEYFGLRGTVDNLIELENLTLREKKYTGIPGRVHKLLTDIDLILEQARKTIEPR